MLGKTLHFRANTDTAWKRHPLTPSSTFEEEFNPHWWSWPPWGFKLEKLIRIFKPINVQQVNVEGIPHNFLTLQRTDPHTTRIFEIWLDPQKEYRSTRILTHRKSKKDLTAKLYHYHQKECTSLPAIHTNSHNLNPISGFRKLSLWNTRLSWVMKINNLYHHTER